MSFDRLRPQEEMRDEIIIYDSVADVRDASARGEVFIFFSHQWLGWSEPDPQRIHVKAMQQAVRAVCTDTDTPLEKIRVWVDYVGKHADAYAFIEPVKDSLFPETFEYVHKGLDGVETTTTQVLFGDLIAAVEDDSARTKDFKPGTNAQRHRFYHIHQHGRNSSRLTDLIRSSFRRVNVSGVDDKEPAASEPPVAAQPAARRQLTWRASAPDYGTI